jgi:hypothetical protein
VKHRRPEPFVPPDDEDEGFQGPAVLVVGDSELDVEIHLADHFEPLDGRTHWYGRVARTQAVVEAKAAGATTVAVRIGDRMAEARLAEFDAWGNLALRGVGTPPYAN